MYFTGRQNDNGNSSECVINDRRTTYVTEEDDEQYIKLTFIPWDNPDKLSANKFYFKINYIPTR